MIIPPGGDPRALAAALLTFILVFVFGAGTAGAGVRVESSVADEAASFWTPARMRAARPLEVSGGRRRGPIVNAEDKGGKAGRIAPVAARVSDFGADFAEVPDPTAAGFRVHGVIFVDLLFGYGRCSGTAVRSPNRSVVITAGHCVHGGGPSGSWFRSDAAFVPAYRFGQRPFGLFPVRWIDSTKQWRASGSENFDVGAMVVGPNERGQSLTEAVGGAGIAWNLKPKQVFDVHGYPAEPPFDGETQRLCSSTPFLGHDPNSFVEPGPLNLAVTCQLNGGASGGGWMIEGGTVLDGVTDYGYLGETSPAYGAYFGKEVARLYSRAAAVR
jgi:V8-like Glu-specific endopeptidase